MTGIYKITNLINGKIYVGQSVNIEKRVKDHLSDRRYGHSAEFDNDIERYGKDAFTYEILELCEKGELNKLERKYIKELRPQYNVVHPGGERDDAFRQKVSDGVKRWWAKLDKRTRKRLLGNLKGPMHGHKVSKATRDKLRAANLGKKQSAETIEKRKASIRKRHETIPQTNAGHRKKIGCEGFEKEFESVKSCAEHLGVDPSTVTKALKRNGKVKGHKVWYVV